MWKMAYVTTEVDLDSLDKTTTGTTDPCYRGYGMVMYTYGIQI